MLVFGDSVSAGYGLPRGQGWVDLLQNRLQQENELLRVALDDIQRMDPEGRLGWYAREALERVDLRE